MTNNLETLLTALYVDLDDRVLPLLGWSRDHRPGRKPELTDAELLCLAVAQQLLGIASERRWIRHARRNLTARQEGKTTLIKLLMGELAPHGGSIYREPRSSPRISISSAISSISTPRSWTT